MFTTDRLFFPKAFYFLFFAAVASLSPFLTLYYEQIGLVGRQIGLLAGIFPLVTLISAPFFGGLADATRQHKLILNLTIGGILVAVLGIFLSTHFLWLILMVVIYAFFFAPTVPLVDNTVLDMLAEQKQEYGKQRLWGAVGWGIAAPVVGLLAEHGGLGWAFYSFFLFMAGTLLISFLMPVSPGPIGQPFWSGMRLLLANWQWAIFLAAAFCGGVGLAIIHNYLFLYLNGLGASKSLMGFALTVATVSEALVMLFSARLLGRWGPRGLLAISLIALMVRLLAYAYISIPGLVLIVQLLHGPTFAAMWVAGVAYAAEMAPPGLGATAQGVYSGVTMGLGAACGAFMGGVLYESLGSAAMFQWAGLAVLLGLIFFVVAGRRSLRLKPTLTKS